MKLSANDALVTGVIIAGICALLWLFAVDINAVSTRSGQKPLGTVVFKKLSATRRPSDALGWERIKNNSPIYNADTLRTENSSEATVYFDDGTSLDISENSMLHLDFGGSVRNLEFIKGEISVGGSKAESKYAISSTAGTITVGKDSLATFSRNEGKVSVDVSRGDATLTRADGTTQTIAQNQELQVDLKNGAAQLIDRPIVALMPETNARILSYSGKEAATDIRFSWQPGNAANAKPAGEKPYTLEISASKDFADGGEKHSVTELSARVPVKPGTWYWRVRDVSANVSPVRKFSIASAQLPQQTFPDDGAEYRFRTVKPEIYFAWTAMDEANAYLFELSSDSSFTNLRIKTRVEATGISIRDLDEGTWYWRVKPVHDFTETGAIPRLAARRIRLVQNGRMEAPVVSTPLEGTLFPVQELTDKGISFAWIPQSDAVSYELAISRSQDLSSPVITVPATAPYLRISGEQCRAISKPGVWYWGVRWIDSEGNKSSASKARKMEGVDGSIAIRSIFPPDGYRIADSLVSNTRFSWKSNVSARTDFIVSRSKDFSDPVFQEKVTAESLLGKEWPIGTYYWKLRTKNIDGSVLSETVPRSFTIVGPLDGPILVAPASGMPFYLHEHDSATVKWNSVPGCDYYAIGIYQPGDNNGKPVFESGHVIGTEFTCKLGNLPGGTYMARIQGFAMETENSTRIIGYIGESTIDYRRLSYIELLDPINGSVIPGIDAWRQGVSLKYKAENPPDQEEFILYRGATKDEEIARSAGKSNVFLRKKLSPGRYSWTVTGSVAGFDISARAVYSFEVLPIPPLPKPVLAEPAQKASFDAERIRAERTITFKWMPVVGATHYNLTISREGPNMPVLFEKKTTGTEFVLKELSKLSKGTFVWRIEARCYDEDGGLEQTGIPAESLFTIDLPAVKRATSIYGDRLYGR